MCSLELHTISCNHNRSYKRGNDFLGLIKLKNPRFSKVKQTFFSLFSSSASLFPSFPSFFHLLFFLALSLINIKPLGTLCRVCAWLSLRKPLWVSRQDMGRLAWVPPGISFCPGVWPGSPGLTHCSTQEASAFSSNPKISTPSLSLVQPSGLVFLSSPLPLASTPRSLCCLIAMIPRVTLKHTGHPASPRKQRHLLFAFWQDMRAYFREHSPTPAANPMKMLCLKLSPISRTDLWGGQR